MSLVLSKVFAYIGMLRYHFQKGYTDDNGNKVEGLPPWIFDELKSITALSYKYDDEGDVSEIVEEIAGERCFFKSPNGSAAPIELIIFHPIVAESMCPWFNLPAERLLDGDSLLFGDLVEHSVVKDILFNFLTPENTRVDLMSSLFGRDGDEDIAESINELCEVCTVEDRDAFDKKKAGPPSIEPRFGTKFWEELLSVETLQQWSSAAAPQIPSPDLLLDLPPQNPFIPIHLDLKPLPGKRSPDICPIGILVLLLIISSFLMLDDDAAHPLLNCSLKVCITAGKKKIWIPAAVTRCKFQKDKSSNDHCLLLSYEDEDEKWHVLDSPKDKALTDDALLEPGYEGTLGMCHICCITFVITLTVTLVG